MSMATPSSSRWTPDIHENCEFVDPIVIAYDSEADVVTVIPKDEARFEVQKQRAIEGLQRAKQAEVFRAQLDLLLGRLANWSKAHEAKVACAYLTLRDTRLSFVIISREAECDDDLEDDASRLDLKVSSNVDLDLIRMNVLVLPLTSTESLQSFVDKRFLIRVWPLPPTT
ncbi:MAG: hypothetical protein WD648_05395 [Planctomycetaceae bacterium]